jgi:hypothetical protein
MMDREFWPCGGSPEPIILISSGRRAADGSLQLPVSPQDFAAAITDPKTVSGESSATAKQIAPSHASGALAEPGGSRLARS